MPANRKKNANALNMKSLVIPAFVLVVIGALAIAWVYPKNQLVFLGREIKKLETEIETVRQQNDVLVGQIANLKSRPQIQFKNEQWSIGLVVPVESQLVHVPVRGASNVRMAGNFDGDGKAGEVRRP